MGIFDFLKKINKSNSKTPGAKKPSVNVSITTSSYGVDCFLADGENVPCLNLRGYTNPSGGFVNYSRFKVVGKNNATGRKNTKHYDAKDESDVAKLAKADGLSEPFEITFEAHKRDTETENYYIAQLRDYHVPIPEGAIKEDLRSILDRVRYSTIVVSEKKVGKDKVIQRVKAMPSPSEEFAQFADDMGIKFSRYIDEVALFNVTVRELTDRNKAAFFAYCVLCSRDQSQIGDFRKSKHISRLYEFADYAIQNNSILQSISGRDPSDYIKPHRGTVAYKAVKEFFELT